MNKKLILLILLIISLTNFSFASHLIGGNFIVKQTSNNSFTISLQVFRDCAGIPLPNSLNVNVYTKNTNLFVQTVTLNRTQIKNIALGDECYTPSLCIEEHFYNKNNVVLNDLIGGYYISYSDCCRNQNISNIIDPGNTDMTYYVDIPNPAILGRNSSPVFSDYPSDGYFCYNYHKFIDFSATDPDGDSLVYSLINPYASTVGTKPFPNVNWAPPYNLSNICGNHILFGVMSINPKTGIISGASDGPGVFLFSVLVEEYRNGIKIGEVHRDIQYESLLCKIDYIPEFNPISTEVDVYLNQEICFDILAKDRNKGDTIFLSISSDDIDVANSFVAPMFNGTNYVYADFQNVGELIFDYFKKDSTQLKGVGIVPMRFCFTPECKNLKDTFSINYTSYSFGCSGSDTVKSSAKINVFYNSPELIIEVPDTIKATLKKQECFDILATDTIYKSDTLFVEGFGNDFDYESAYLKPDSILLDSGLFHFYTNFYGIDTFLIKGFQYKNGIVGAIERVPLRYCFIPDCSSPKDGGYHELNYMVYSKNCAIDTIKATTEVLIEYGYIKEIPNIITPNGDEINDDFYIKDLRSGDWSYFLFNRWGQKVVEDFNFKGVWKPNDLPSGMYYYTLHDAVCDQFYKSWIQILR